MIVTDCSFNPKRDLKPVEQFGAIDRKSAFATGVVPTVVPDAETDYNGIDNPASILGKPEDVFEAMHMQAAMNDYTPDPGTEKKDS